MTRCIKEPVARHGGGGTTSPEVHISFRCRIEWPTTTTPRPKHHAYPRSPDEPPPSEIEQAIYDATIEEMLAEEDRWWRENYPGL